MPGQMAEGRSEEPQRGLMGTLRITGSMELPEKVEMRNVNKKRRQLAFVEEPQSPRQFFDAV